MLIGSCVHNVDTKGRIFIPSKWRDDLGNTIIVTRGLLGGGESKCLFAMSLAAWADFAGRLSSLPEADVSLQDVRRVMFANACDCELDKQGRILISNPLREYAGLTAEATLIGVDTRIEIWASDAWEKHNARISEHYDAKLEKLASIGV
ncbi:MAG: division/cell wall cluster transcriptional repressor MraZ [Bacillota bacterium]